MKDNNTEIEIEFSHPVRRTPVQAREIGDRALGEELLPVPTAKDIREHLVATSTAEEKARLAEQLARYP